MRLFAILSMIAWCASFMSCGSDDDDVKKGDKTSNLLIGTWEVVYESDDNDFIETLTIRFNPDNTYLSIVGDNHSTTIGETKGTYTYDPEINKLSFIYKDGDSDSATIVEISDTKLVLEWWDNSGTEVFPQEINTHLSL